MAIKGDQVVIADDINFRCAEVATKGMLLSYSSTAGYVEKTASALSTTDPAGILLTDVVNKDFGAVPQNHQKIETGLSGYVRLVKIGQVRTNHYATASSYVAGTKLYLGDAGIVRPLSAAEQANGDLPHVGHALGAADSDSYLRFWINLT